MIATTFLCRTRGQSSVLCRNEGIEVRFARILKIRIGCPLCHCETGAHIIRKGYAASVTLVPRERLRSGRGNLRL